MREPRSAHHLYGRRAVAESLRGRRVARTLILAEGIKDDARIRAIIESAANRGIPVERWSRSELDLLLGAVNHQGIALDAESYPYTSPEEIFAQAGTILGLDHLQDPQNLGTLLRAAEAAGVVGVLLPADRSAGITPSVVNASAGAVEHLRIALVPNLTRALSQAKDAGWWVAGLDATAEATDLYVTDLPDPIALVVGSEASGLGQNLRRHCDLLVSIPMVGAVASLNAATAGSIALFELMRRQRSVSS